MILWEAKLMGNDGIGVKVFSHSQLLTSGQAYSIEAWSEAGTMATPQQVMNSRNSSFDFTAHFVPEPSILVLTALGLLTLAFCGRRRKR